ncbi:conserved hypothetical protein [Candidatus Terasakiella magnetica]|uniref:Uncharacterized protein n=1 Tax=Candidatus Terasakiella magnetica TaxID=1867952 RepID=A0A1C3RER0_9PROT|nr:hypothetical protein [Candidatus Terasakiella magnetica]SCA55786.1 conserved hypothetical protein [Candidatus Terasakiella magnetica]
MDAAAVMDIYDEAFDEAIARGIADCEATREAKTAAAMMLAAMDGLEDMAAYDQVEQVVQSNMLN